MPLDLPDKLRNDLKLRASRDFDHRGDERGWVAWNLYNIETIRSGGDSGQTKRMRDRMGMLIHPEDAEWILNHV